jgi:hypothetical protein
MAGVENSVGRRAWATLVTACGGKAQPALDGVATRPNSIASYIHGVIEKKEDEDVKDLAIIQDALGVCMAFEQQRKEAAAATVWR